ncbi:HU family DNA-binding protein (plasmid) [Azospirillum sp. HJ39]|uniref:HU family DNA-binding protein n=1 Tax=Azospirillum sp. HJ39 TaxID=3159496 RepID=UPI00355612E3
MASPDQAHDPAPQSPKSTARGATMSTVNKPDLAAQLSAKTGITKADAARHIDVLTDLLVSNLLDGNDVRLHGLGTLKTEIKPEHEARNPATGETFTAPAKRVVKFKAQVGVFA